MYVYRVARTMKHGVVGGELCSTCPLNQVTGEEGESEGTTPVSFKREK